MFFREFPEYIFTHAIMRHAVIVCCIRDKFRTLRCFYSDFAASCQLDCKTHVTFEICHESSIRGHHDTLLHTQKYANTEN